MTQKPMILAVVLAAFALGGCSSAPKIEPYYGPEVTRIVVMKAERKMYLLNEGDVLEDYDIDLGFAPVGDKTVEGDGKTPEGRYLIDRRNPRSAFHLSLGISYPDKTDIAEAEALGAKPGGDIFIHGQSRKRGNRGTDWTAGCISVSNKEIEKVYSMVQDGTVIDIFP